MSKFKNAALALAAAGLFTAQAHASEAQATSLQAAPVAAVFSALDIQGMFEQAGKPMEVAALSSVEMKETEGAFNPWGAAGGAVWGGGSVVMNNIGRGIPVRQWNAGTILVGAGAGALSGGFAHMRPIAAFVVPRVTFFGSFAAGRRGW